MSTEDIYDNYACGLTSDGLRSLETGSVVSREDREQRYAELEASDQLAAHTAARNAAFDAQVALSKAVRLANAYEPNSAATKALAAARLAAADASIHLLDN